MFERTRVFLFDFDGTLVEPSIDFDEMRRATVEIVARYGVDITAWPPMPVLELAARVEGELAAGNHDRAATFRREVEEAIIDIELAAAEGVLAYQGVPTMLRQLCAWGYRVGIVTRNCRLAVERVLANNALPYDILLTRDDVPYVKPDPRHLTAALEALGEKAEHTVMCGDHPMDIIAGQRIGAATVGVLRPGVQPEYFDEVRPDLILAHVTDLVDHVARDRQ